MIMRASSTVYVVDPAPGDYDAIARSVAGEGAHLTFLKCGRDALRQQPFPRPDLWIINMNLPDIPGADLYDMLHSRYPGVPFYLVGDDYSTDDEMAARRCGATLYLCKPLQTEWVFAQATAPTP